MRFVTNKISTGKSKSFADLVADFTKKQEPAMTKQASAVAPVVKVAEGIERTKATQEEGPSSGQLEVEPLHQEGESTPKVKGKTGAPGTEQIKSESSAKEQPKTAETAKVAEVKVAEGVQDKKNENNEPAAESGQTKADFPKLTNDPEAEKHRDGDGDQKKAKATEQPVKEAAGLANFGDKKAEPFGKKDEAKGEAKPCDDGKEKKDDKKAAAVKFVKVSNLDSKSKSWLKKYWSDLYPSEYADAMVVDK